MKKQGATPKRVAGGIPAFKSKGGRGHKATLADLIPGWQDIIISEMSGGASLTEIKALLGIPNNRHAAWMKAPDEGAGDDYLEYRTVIQYGEQMGQAWWEKAGRTNLKNPAFNNTLWYMNMKNRFGWKDKSDVVFSDPGRDAAIKKIISFGGTKIELS